jgi:3-oxoadipate enol-lactonase
MKAKINNLQIEYEVHGPPSAVPTVFIHGFPFSKEMWNTQVEVLKKDFYLVTYDVRGHGGSEAGDNQFTLEYFVDDLIGLLDHLRLESVVVVGLSMGGYIALRAIERHPERFRGLVLCNTRSEADGNEAKIKRAQQARSVKVDGIKKFAEGFVKAVFYEKTFHSNPRAVELIRSIIENTPPLTVAGTLIALAGRTDTSASLPAIRVPTLILVGEHDTLTPPSASLAMKEKIPNAEMYIIPNAAHMSNLENPEVFNDHLVKFLKKLPRQ